jgi:hypothetical protein
MTDLLDAQHIWWEQITGPAALVSRVAWQLQEGRTIVLQVPDDLPWRQQMRGSVEDNLRFTGTNVVISLVDCSDECPADSDIGTYLLQRFWRGSDVRNGYRPTSRQTIQDYLKKHGVLQNQIIWVKGIEPAQEKRWLEFCRHYPSSGAAQGLFVLEIHTEAWSGKLPAHMQCVRFAELVGPYDTLLFASQLVADKGLSVPWKQYAAALAASLFGDDAEAAAEFLDQVNLAEDDPIDVLTGMLDYFPMRGRSSNLHPFALLRQDAVEMLQKRIWQAQIQIVFPMIETERALFIEKWSEQIQRTLDSNRGQIMQYGNEVTEPFEAELGLLAYLSRNRASDGLYLLYIPDEADRERLEFLHRRRNELAHITACSPQDLDELFSKHPFFKP